MNDSADYGLLPHNSQQGLMSRWAYLDDLSRLALMMAPYNIALCAGPVATKSA